MRADFEQALQDLPTVRCERPDVINDDDAKIEQFAELTQRISCTRLSDTTRWCIRWCCAV